jgi:S1-C subfamily serine protease
MSLSKDRSPYLPQIATMAVAIALSVGLTLATLRAFPTQLLPAYAKNSSELPAPSSSATIDAHSQRLNQRIPATNSQPRNFVTAAVNRVGASVVRIDTEKTVKTNIPTPFFDDPFFRQFFGDDSIPNLPREFRQYGEGSGFIIDANGIILTNAHVVSGVDRVKVTLKDGRTLEGKVRGIDRPSDLAVVKVNGQNLPVAPLGDSSQVQVGDWAISVGNPFGLDNTVTLGIVSTIKRSSAQVGIPDKRLDFIQTDAAINPGNSGGPLLNDRGEVIAINTAMRVEAQGIGFAIPIDTAKAIKDRLARGEKIPHPYLGIRMLTLTPAVAKQLNSEPNKPFTAPEISGVLVVQVLPDSPAAKAGLRLGDTIVEVEGQAVTTADRLQDLVAKSRIGQPLQLKVQRDRQIERLSIRPAELRETTQD